MPFNGLPSDTYAPYSRLHWETPNTQIHSGLRMADIHSTMQSQKSDLTKLKAGCERLKLHGIHSLHSNQIVDIMFNHVIFMGMAIRAHFSHCLGVQLSIGLSQLHPSLPHKALLLLFSRLIWWEPCQCFHSTLFIKGCICLNIKTYIKLQAHVLTLQWCAHTDIDLFCPWEKAAQLSYCGLVSLIFLLIKYTLVQMHV